MKFELDIKQHEQLNDWLATKDMTKYQGAIGGRLKFCFVPTSIGEITIVIDSFDKSEIDLTDYDSW